jgi:hypothetical protein
MRAKYFFGLCIFTVLLAAPIRTSTAVLKKPQADISDVFQAAPVGDRDYIRSSVDLIINLWKQRQWGQIYDLQDHPLVPRDKFLKDSFHPSWTLMDFTPTRVHEAPACDPGWDVNGCALVMEQGKRLSWEAIIWVTHQDAPKRIRLVIAANKHGGPMPCLAGGA